MSASGSLLPPLPYKPDERGDVPVDLLDTKLRMNPKSHNIEHCFIFGIPGIEEGVFTYRGNLEACTDVMNLLHSGRFKVGYKSLKVTSLKGDSTTSLEMLFKEQSLEAVPER